MARDEYIATLPTMSPTPQDRGKFVVHLIEVGKFILKFEILHSPPNSDPVIVVSLG
jgi:hypothetical protein